MRFLQVQLYQISNSIYQESQDVKIYNMTAVNYYISQQPFIYINSQNVLFDNMKISKVNFSTNKKSQQIPLIALTATYSLIIQNSLLSQINNFKNSSIQIQDSQNIKVFNTIFQNIYSNDTSSALTIQNSQNIDILNSVFKDMNLNNTGSIQIINGQNIVFQSNELQFILSQIGDGGALNFINSQINKLDQNQFISNTALLGSGGAIFCQNSAFKAFNENIFNKNKAPQGSGGAIMLNNCDILQMKNNTFILNQAFIGGAIRYTNLQPIAIMQGGAKNLKILNYFYKNNATSYGINIGSYPVLLNMKNNFEKNSISQQDSLIDVQSGYKAPTPILIRFIDEEMREVAFVNLSQYPFINKDILQEMSQYILQAESDNIGLIGDLKQAYQLKNYAFVFDLSYSYKPSSNATLIIKSSQLLPQFLSNNQQAQLLQFSLSINIQFRKCKIGEVIQKSGNNTICYTCQQGHYSLIDPYLDQSISCKACPTGSITCQNSQIQIQNGYWRQNDSSDIIVQCQYQDICQPENPLSKNGCNQGHVGPLCQECDIKGQVWGSSYCKSQQKICNNCINFYSPTNIALMILLLGFIFYQIYSNIHKKISHTKKYILAKYLSKFNLISPNIYRKQANQPSLVKILLSYCQFLMIFNSLNISLPDYFIVFSSTGGDTSQLTIYSIDCLLFSYDLKLPNYIIRLLWINLQPIGLFLLIEIFSQFRLKKMIINAQKYTIYTNLIIIFLYFQSSIVKVISQSLSCQQIGNTYFVSSDLNYNCLDDQHIRNIIYFIIPLGLIWVVFIPLFLFIKMRKYKNQMQTIKTLFIYGYLYQVIKFLTYNSLIQYQEFAKINYNYFSLNKNIKSLLIIFINNKLKILNLKKQYIRNIRKINITGSQQEY
ncbi:transmembrane protein, putative (macronuclear) [Tetrahymena thermophila SB210]|uniref:Transmembrane protein, putative n=1 Tax=Tetrahymena thermophila (strain SB210) TaxID=312017 RepID=W7X7V8_TETTS|nr:transmembrane protein, putative [Tetrahymena thermophila SB210]EWS72513.1 transmembrane protein, putative [Tetrahymena thermophila SB210]|eukprot:XP_012654949.1 transmembrane protein, putative [Tetrahymena thermophila SB210]